MSIGFIYAITSASTDRIYIGSTQKKLNYRFNEHKSTTDYSSNEIIKYGDAVIKLLKEIKYENIDELRWKEREYQEIFGDQCINNNRAIITEEEVKEYQKEYYQNNKETIREQQKEYYEKNQDKIKAYKKEYRQNNQDKIKAYKKKIQTK